MEEDVGDDAILWKCKLFLNVTVGKEFLKFQTMVVPLSSGSSSPRNIIRFGLLDREDPDPLKCQELLT